MADDLSSQIDNIDLDESKKEDPKEEPVDEEEEESEGSSSTASIDSILDAAVAPDEAESMLLEATTLKEQGNTFFKESKLDDAARSYRKGTNLLKKLNRNNEGDPQVQALLVTLQTNLATVSFKQAKYQRSLDVATSALQLDPSNVKALYRRAVAARKVGDDDKAKQDLQLALQADPTNAPCRKELASLLKALQVAKAAQKQALQKAFSGSGLYSDKVEAQKKLEERKAKEKKEQQELYKKRKAEWEDECVRRMSKNEPAISFEKWEKELKEAEEAKRKEEEKKRKEAEKKRKEEEQRRRAERKAASASNDSDDSDDELTEQELALMRGYKKTKDGRTTSYFTRELDDEAKAKIGDIAPKKLEPAAPAKLKASTEGASAWNKAGTWEEKDCTKWCHDTLRARLEATSASGACSVEIKSVEELTGDGSVALAAGKKRFIFDFHAKLKYEVRTNDSDEKVASGVVRLPDICSTSHEELEVTYEGWKTKPSASREAMAMGARASLSSALRGTVQRWVAEFNEAF